MNLLGEKIIGIFVVFIVPLITGSSISIVHQFWKILSWITVWMKPTLKGLLIPLIFHRRRQRPSIAPLSSASTGILLGVFLLHVLPRSTERLRHALEGSVYQTYPGILVCTVSWINSIITLLPLDLSTRSSQPSFIALLKMLRGMLRSQKWRKVPETFTKTDTRWLLTGTFWTLWLVDLFVSNAKPSIKLASYWLDLDFSW